MKIKKNDIIYIFISFFLLIVLGLYIFRNYNRGYLKIEEGIEVSVYKKGLKGAVDFLVKDEVVYVAFKDKIIYIGKDGFSKILVENSNFDIYSIDIFEDKLYFSETNNLYSLNLINGENEIIIKDLPNKGDYKNIEIKIVNNELYLSIPSITNSGVVGEDNKWLNDNPDLKDLTPIDLVLNGYNFNNNSTGAFVSYGQKNHENQTVKASEIGNSSVLKLNLDTYKYETFATGIRNITSMSDNSKQDIIFSTGGYENRGFRPVLNDVDYIYKLDKNEWYGFPDFSGGDPLNSDRFNGYNQIAVILKNVKNVNPPKPLYQHDKIASIYDIIVDKKGMFYDKDGIFFYDKILNSIMYFNNKGPLREIVRFTIPGLYKMEIDNRGMYFLHSQKGYIYKMNII